MAGDMAEFAAGAGGMGEALKGLAATALQAATGYDAALGRFRNSAGQFQGASSVASGIFQGSMGKIASAAKDVTPSIAGLGSALVGFATGPVPSATAAGKMLGKEMAGAMTDGAKQLSGALSALGPEGAAVGAVIEALTGVMAATVGTMMTVAGMAVDIAQKVGMVTARFAALAGTAAGGKAVQAMLSHLDLPFASSKVSAWAQTLLAAGIKGQQLERDIKAVAAATALMGESGGAAAEAMFKRLGEGGPAADKLLADITKGGRRSDAMLKEMGLSLADLGGKAAVAKMKAGDLHNALAKAMASKGAGPLAAMGNTLPVILTKAQEGLRSLFTGLVGPVDKFMASVKSMFAMFNKGGPMVGILKPIVTSVFSTLFSWAKRAVDFVHSAFQQIVIAGLKVRIAIQPIVVAFRQLYGELQKAAAASGLFTGKGTAMATVFALVKSVVVGTFMVAVTVVTGFIRALAGMASIAAAVIGKVRSVFKGLTFPNLAGAAANMITSFISGISAKIGSVVAAMAGMGAAAKRGLLGALGIASPSKVAVEAAGNVTGSFTDKVDDGKGAARKAFDGLAKVPGKTGGTGTSAAGGGGSSALVAALDRVATALEMSPGSREAMHMAFLEAEQEGA